MDDEIDVLKEMNNVVFDYLTKLKEVHNEFVLSKSGDSKTKYIHYLALHCAYSIMAEWMTISAVEQSNPALFRGLKAYIAHAVPVIFKTNPKPQGLMS